MRTWITPLLLTAACATSREPVNLPAAAPAAELPAAKPARFVATEVRPVTETLHGVAVADPYRWLEDEKSPEVQAWMTAQDAAARRALEAFPGRAALTRRFHELFYAESVSAPVQRGERLFYLRTHPDREKAILYVRPSASGAERVLLDPNGWSTDGTVSLGRWVPSWDGRKLAYLQRPNAADEAVLHVLDVDNGTESKVDVIAGAKYADPQWTPDGKGFYYEWLPSDASIPASERPGYTEIRFHALGTDPARDALVHPRTNNPSTFLKVQLSRDGRYLFANINRGWAENDVFFRDLKRDKAFRTLVLGKDARYEVIPWRDQFYVITNEGASNHRVLRVDPRNPDRKNWKEIVPEDAEAALDRAGFDIAGDRLVLHYLKNASSELRLVSLDGKQTRRVALPGIGSIGAVHGLADSDTAWMEFSSFTTPRQVYKVSVRAGATELWAKVNLPIAPENYEIEQVWYPSKDGTRISMFLVHRKGLAKNGDNPTLLYGYGGFNVSMTPAFRASIYPWLEAGGVYAIANLRGGGEYGKKWHDAGRLHVKQNVFDDYARAAEWLIENGYTKASRLAIYGGSNGGLLVGAAMTQRPELFGAVVCAVPLLDMVRYHLFGSGRTWIPEYGTAEKPEDFAVLQAYSPYHHVAAGVRYPALLMLSADHDDRVDPIHARKFVAAVQAATASEAPVLLRVERNAGHQGADQVSKAIEQSADLYGFLMQQLGVGAPAQSMVDSR